MKSPEEIAKNIIDQFNFLSNNQGIQSQTYVQLLQKTYDQALVFYPDFAERITEQQAREIAAIAEKLNRQSVAYKERLKRANELGTLAAGLLVGGGAAVSGSDQAAKNAAALGNPQQEINEVDTAGFTKFAPWVFVITGLLIFGTFIKANK